MSLESLKRAQPKGAVRVEDGDRGQVGKSVHKRCEIVGSGARGVQRQGALNGTQRHLVLPSQNDDDPSGNRERGRVIGVAGYRRARVN